MSDHIEAYLMARRKFLDGEKPTFSSGLDGEWTAGYGELNEFGYWEFPLPMPAEFAYSRDEGFLDAYYKAVEELFKQQKAEAKEDVGFPLQEK